MSSKSPKRSPKTKSPVKTSPRKKISKSPKKTTKSPSRTPTRSPKAKNTIAAVAASNDQFKTLVAALGTAGLLHTLQGKGPLTVFAPTDAAFANLPQGVLNDTEKLKEILLYHVVRGNFTSARLVKTKKLTTLDARQPIHLAVHEGNLILNGHARVLMIDIPASNGRIHVIDQVLMPPNMSATPAMTGSPMMPMAATPMSPMAPMSPMPMAAPMYQSQAPSLWPFVF